MRFACALERVRVATIGTFNQAWVRGPSASNSSRYWGLYHVDVDAVSREELEVAQCWEADDRVPRRPDLTDFRRRLRYHQAQWREAHGHPIGTQPIVPLAGGAVRPVGSRLPLDYARATGANFLTASALGAVEARLRAKEPQQSLSAQRLWADLLSSPAFCFNLFGDLAADLALADRAVHTWWPDAPGTVSEVRFAHSPGRLDPAYLGNLVAWDVAFVLDLGGGRNGIIGIVTGYHEHVRPQPPKPSRIARYVECSERAGVFAPAAIDAVNGTDLIHVWLEHLLVLSMLQQPGGRWAWARYALVYPEGNPDFVSVDARYRTLLADQSTYASMTLETLLGSGALPATTAAAVRERYVVDSSPSRGRASSA
jgi:hypothetical protein